MILAMIRRYGFRMPRGVTLFHSKMHHGDEAVGHYRRGDQRRRLHLWKNLYRLPKFFMPESDLVIAQSVAEPFRRLPGVVCRQVVFQSVFSYRYAVRDMSFLKDFPLWEQWEGDVSWQKPRQLAHDPSLPLPDEPYYEVRAPHLRDVAQGGARYIGEVLKSPDAGAPVIPLELSEQWYRECGMVWEWGTIIADWLLEKIEPHINTNYFWIQEFRMRKA